ncbi:MAG: DUF1428 domain-containing protein [Gemmatimonadota bacterium]|nr:DUF1428 domain-containing protein [Gemmatimonadota bacterium]
MNASPFGKPALRAVLLVFVSVLAVGATWSVRGDAQDAGSIYEVRDYHIDPARLDDYRDWAENHGLAYLRQELDVVGFWVDSGVEAEVNGEVVDPMGPANVTWIIRWPSKAERDARMGTVFSTPEWQEVFARLPGGGGNYKRIQSRFFTGL